MSRSVAPVVEAAGAVVWRVHEGRFQVLLVHRPRYDDWSWPKGKLEPGELLPVCARREVAEETGVEIVLGRPLPSLEYDLADGRRKRVHYWAARPAADAGATASLTARDAVHPADRAEIDHTRWLDAYEARQRLTREQDRRPLDVLLADRQAGALHTQPVVVVRHGRARKRARWSGGEADRPLTRVGRRQAADLVQLLAVFGVERVVTSPWERCWRTVHPYATAAHLPLVAVPSLTEAAHVESPARVAEVVHGLLTADEPVALCTHRPVLPTVLDVVQHHGTRSAVGAMPVTDPFLRPGQVLVAHVAATRHGHRVVAVESHRAR